MIDSVNEGGVCLTGIERRIRFKEHSRNRSDLSHVCVRTVNILGIILLLGKLSN